MKKETVFFRKQKNDISLGFTFFIQCNFIRFEIETSEVFAYFNQLSILGKTLHEDFQNCPISHFEFQFHNVFTVLLMSCSQLFFLIFKSNFRMFDLRTKVRRRKLQSIVELQFWTGLIYVVLLPVAAVETM